MANSCCVVFILGGLELGQQFLTYFCTIGARHMSRPRPFDDNDDDHVELVQNNRHTPADCVSVIGCNCLLGPAHSVLCLL